MRLDHCISKTSSHSLACLHAFTRTPCMPPEGAAPVSSPSSPTPAGLGQGEVGDWKMGFQASLFSGKKYRRICWLPSLLWDRYKWKKLFWGMGSGGRNRSFQSISTFYKKNSQILISLFVGPSRLYYIFCTYFLCNLSRLRGVKGIVQLGNERFL